MKIVQITPGAGGMFCGGCLRDNAMVKDLRDMGHEVLMVPLYLPLTLESADQSAGTPIFFGGINVFLDQTLGFFRCLPAKWTQWLDQRSLLRWISRYAARTRPEDVGPLTVSMLMGKEGRQRKELEILLDWLSNQIQPDVVCLSNALLMGMVQPLKEKLGCPVVCTLQGEDSFLDRLPEEHRTQAWKTLKEQALKVDAFIAPSRFFGEVMGSRLELAPTCVHVVPNGIPVEGYTRSSLPEQAPVLGYFARMCREKGLPMLVDAFLQLKERTEHGDLHLMIGGGLGPSDVPLVNALKRSIEKAGWTNAVRWFPNPDRSEKLKFFSSLTLFSVPALYGEAYGLYLLEAMAAGVPVVQPPHAAFPEIIEDTGGGICCEGLEAMHLAEGIETILNDRERLDRLSNAGHASVHGSHQSRHMASKVLKVLASTGNDLE
jgi:glycosyltransferase involved in cell wall biosynthesis